MLGGRQDKNETSLEAAKRELVEESGLISNDWELFREYSTQLKIEWKVIIFIARNCEKKFEPRRESREDIKLIKVNFDEFLSYIKLEKFLSYIKLEKFGVSKLALEVLRMSSLIEFKKNLFG